MSRSRRKTPVLGVTTARTEKDYKHFMHHKLRQRVRRQLRTEEHLKIDPDIMIFPIKNEVMNTWSMPKDGKQRLIKPKPYNCERCTHKLDCMILGVACRRKRDEEDYKKYMRK
jgi:hypothetical protein